MWTLSEIMFRGVNFGLITAAINGCIDKDGEEGIYENCTSSLTPFQTDSTVLPAPEQQFLHPDFSETFQFRDNNITISYLSTYLHPVEVNIGRDTKAIGIKRSTRCPGDHCGYYATKDDIDFSIKPVVGRYNEAGEIIWSFGTCNNSE